LYSQPYTTQLQQKLHNKTIENLYNYKPQTKTTNTGNTGNTITSDNFDSYPSQLWYQLTSKYFYGYFTYTSDPALTAARFAEGPQQYSDAPSQPNVLYMDVHVENTGRGYWRDTRMTTEWYITSVQNIAPNGFTIRFNVYINTLYAAWYNSRLGIVFILLQNGRQIGAISYVLNYTRSPASLPAYYYGWVWPSTVKVIGTPKNTWKTITITTDQILNDLGGIRWNDVTDILIAFSSRPEDGPSWGDTGDITWRVDDLSIYTGNGGGGGTIVVSNIGQLIPLIVYGWSFSSSYKASIPYNYYQAFYGIFTIEAGWITPTLTPSVEIPSQAWYVSKIRYNYNPNYGYWEKY
ncbi:MAG: hypothetical protein ACP5IZ_09830, partial [Thermoprotei archaeon]